MRIERMRCEHADTPLAVHRLRPRLSWIATETQTSWRVLASSRQDVSSGDLWDSGTVRSDENLVIYSGKPLFSRQPCWWKVCCNDTWSSAARFEMGLLSRGDWAGKWIESPDSSCRAPLFRKRFTISRLPTRARAYICGLGYYELHINGRRVGDHVLDPAQTDYETRALYVAHDVTPLLVTGENVIGVMLGCGFYAQDRVWGGMSYGRPKMIFQLSCDDAPPIVSDKTWRTTVGPVIENNVYAGETYDARREIDTERDEGVAAVEVAWPTKNLEPQLMPPIRRVRILDAMDIRKIGDAQIFDFGQNFAGWARLTLEHQPAGAAIRMRSAEDVKPDGSLDTASTGVFATNVEQIETYVPKGAASETYEPRFTYHGFRYVEVTGVKPHANALLDGVVVHTDLERVGTFESSDPILNRIHDAAIWTLISNLHGIPTDCPAREKCGWLGDAQIHSEFALSAFDATPLFDKYLRDIDTSWKGERPGDVAPGKRCSEPNGHLDWGLATVLLPWHMWLYRGDDTILHDHYDSMRRIMLAAQTIAKDGIFANGYGDWCPPGSVEPTQTPPALTTTAWFAHAGRIMTSVARRLQHEDDAATFESIAKSTTDAFNRSFFKESDRTYGSQCADAMALSLDLCPQQHVDAVAASLRHDVMEKHDAHHTTGIFGSRFLHAALSRHGHGDAALALLRQTTYPSIGDLFARGATTFWECWGEEELDKKWGARSKNHPMQAAFVAWFYQGLGGINPSPDQPGFKHVIIRPDFLDLEHVKVTHLSRHGLIASEWRRRNGRIELDVSLPPNVTATIYLPSRNPTDMSGRRQFKM